MTAFVVLAVVLALVGAIWWTVPSLRAWPPSLGLMLCAATIVPPHETLAVGIGADDVPLLIGVVVLVIPALRLIRRDGVPRAPFGRLVAVGAVVLTSGMVVSAFVNAESVGGTLSMLMRGAGRVVIYAVLVTAIVVLHAAGPVRRIVMASLVGVATLQSVISVLGYTIGLPGGFGLAPVDGGSSLVGEIPGRAIGTTGLASNFLGALLVLTIPLTLGWWLAEGARPRPARRSRTDRRRRVRWVLLVSVSLQLATLVLTYTRVSLVVATSAALVVVALRLRVAIALAGRVPWRRVVAVGAVVAVIGGIVLVATPLAQRLTTDGNDRLALYASALRVFAAHPVAGVGPGEQADITAADPANYRATSYGVATANAHNTLLLAAAEDGILGLVGSLLCTLGLAGAAGVAVVRGLGDGGLRAAAGVAVLAFLLQGMTNNLYTVTLTATAMLLVLAGCVWQPYPGRGRHARRGGEPVSRARRRHRRSRSAA